ncbi:MAG: type IV pilus assembly protein PilM [Mycobacteriales bacterium]
MASKVVGLDIGTSGVRAAELTLGKGGATLERFGQVALPPGAVRNGEVVDSDAVAAAVKQLWTQAKFSSKKVVVGVANQKVVVRQVDLPWLPPAELKKALAFQVQDFIPMPVEQAILDFHPLEEFTNDSGARMVRVLLVAAARDMVDSALSAVSKAGLTPQMVDLTSFAVLRALVSMDHTGLDSMQAEALIDVGASVTNIVVHQGGVPRFVRILLMGGADITDAVAERLGVPLEQAEGIKQDSGLAAVPGGNDSSPAARAIESTGSAFVEEVRGSLDYFMAQPGAVRVGRIVVSGGGSRLNGLAERLASATRLPVQAARPMSTLKLGKTGLTSDQLAYVEPMVSVPVGLAMGVSA